MNLFLKLMAPVFKRLAKAYVESTKTTFDDNLYNAITLGLDNVDYGLQRKPTGPRKKVAKKAVRKKA